MTTLTLQPDGAAAQDTYLASNNATTNYGTDAVFQVGEVNTDSNFVRRTLIKFDLSSIPSNAVITSATLTLTIEADRSSNTRDYKVYRVLRDWIETEATWNVWSTGNNWTTAGCGSAGNDFDSTVWATTSFSDSEAVNSEKSFTLDTAEFTKLIDGTYTNYGWKIQADTETNDAYRFHSSDGATASYRPKLVVEYTTPSGNDKFFLMFD